MQRNFWILCHGFWSLTCLLSVGTYFNFLRQNACEGCSPLEWLKSASSDGSGGKMIRGRRNINERKCMGEHLACRKRLPSNSVSYIGLGNCSKAEIYQNLPELLYAIVKKQKASCYVNLLFTKSLYRWKLLTPCVCAILMAKLFIELDYAATFCLHFISTQQEIEKCIHWLRINIQHTFKCVFQTFYCGGKNG